MNSLPDKIINHAPALKELSTEAIAKKVESYFINDNEDLLETLALFDFENLIELFNVVETFFKERLDLENLTRLQIENLDYKALSYDFANKLKLERPLIPDRVDKKKAIHIIGKLARLFVHEILFPELIKIDIRLALTVKSQLKRAIGAIAIIEGVEKQFAYNLIKIDDVSLDMQSYFLPPAKEHKEKSTRIYFKTCLSESEVDRLGRDLKTNYGIIVSVAQFRGLIFSGEQWDGSIKLKTDKQKWFIWLMHQMYNSNNDRKRLIWLNKTKGYWRFLQGIVIDEDDDLFTRDFAKICNEIKDSNTKESILIRKDIETILESFKRIL